MSRAVLLPTPGDPFLLQYWINLYKNVWGEEVDSLYVYINSEISDEMVVANSELFDQAGVKRVLYANTMIDHGKALEELLRLVEEDEVMLIEDDGFIFRNGIVDECFNILEKTKYKVVGSKRGSCSQEILDLAAQKWELDYAGYGDQGCNFWPNFLFIKTDLLQSISGHFGASAWQAGDMVEGLEMRTTEFANGDTFVSASLRIRSKLDKMIPAMSDEKLRGNDLIWYEPQYHGATDDMVDYNNRTNLWDGRASWTHAGSLSTGITNLLNINKPLPKHMADTEQEKLELERRVMYWQIFWENATPGILEQEHKEYGQAIRRLINHYQLNDGRISQRKRAYYELLPRFANGDFYGQL